MNGNVPFREDVETASDWSCVKPLGNYVSNRMEYIESGLLKLDGDTDGVNISSDNCIMPTGTESLLYSYPMLT